MYSTQFLSQFGYHMIQSNGSALGTVPTFIATICCNVYKLSSNVNINQPFMDSNKNSVHSLHVKLPSYYYTMQHSLAFGGFAHTVFVN